MVGWRSNERDREETEPLVGSATAEAVAAEVSESSALLGAGTRNGSVNGTRKDSWVGYEDFEGLPWWKTPSVFWLLGPYFLFTLAFGGIIVPKLNLIVDLVCRRYFADQALLDPNFTFVPVILGGDNPQCQDPDVQTKVQKRVSLFTLCLSLITGIVSAVVAPKLGYMSDRYGRKRLMALASCGGLCAEVITILAARYPDVVSYNWMALGSLFDGLTGSFTAGSVLSHSYTSDCTPPSQRGVSIGYLHACLFTGLAFGPLLASYFVEWTDSLLSIFYIALGCHAVFIVFIVLVLPESLSLKKQALARERHAAKREEQARERLRAGDDVWQRALHSLRTANLLEPLHMLWPVGPGASALLRRNLLSLAVIDTALIGAAMGAMTVILLYSRLTFGWLTPESSRFMSIVSLSRVVILMGIVPVVNYLVRTRPAAAARKRREAAGTAVAVAPETNAGADELDVWLIRFALFSDMLGVIGYIFAPTGTVFVLCGIVTAFGGVGSATIQAAITKHVPADQVGQLLGAIGLLHALSRVLAPIAFNGLYSATVETFPQAIFVLLASVFACALVGSILVRPHVYLREEPGTQDERTSLTASQHRQAAESAEALEEDALVVRVA